MQSISLFILAFNEEATLEQVTRQAWKALSRQGGDFELVVIDDGSTDKTGKIADRLSHDLERVSVIHHGNNCGLGTGYRTAFARATKDLLTFYSADGQFSADLLDKFLPLAQEHDMVLGYLPKRNDSLLSRALSRVEKALFFLLFGPMPKFQGVLMFRRRLLDKIELLSPGGRPWTVLMELIIKTKKRGYKITSIPIEMKPRACGRSKVNNPATIWANFRQLLALRARL